MNIQQVRLANSSHVLVNNSGVGRHNSARGYAIGEQLRTRQDVDLQVGEGVVSVPKGSPAKVERNNSQQVLLDLGESLGKFVLDLSSVDTYFERALKAESVVRNCRQVVLESNPTVATPGAYVEVTSYDPKIGPNRGPKSPGHGGYQILVGQKGQIATIFGEINGIKTYKVQLMQGGEFVLGETEFRVIRGVGTQESAAAPKNRNINENALMALGLGL